MRSFRHFLAVLYYRLSRLRRVKLPFDGYLPAKLGPTSELAGILRPDQITLINNELDWHAFTVDSQGRRIGNAHGSSKRNEPQDLVDKRIDALNDVVPLHLRVVHEYGCFEGIHTLALARKGAIVTGFDARPMNIAKSALRVSLYDETSKFCLADLDDLKQLEHLARTERLKCDVLVHIGVLYHLANPEGHLSIVLPQVREAVLIDTHVSESESEVRREFGISDPFSGTGPESRWVSETSLKNLFVRSGFSLTPYYEIRNERNGRRLTAIWQRCAS